MNEIELWEILVPTIRNDGRPIKTRFHKVWDEKVKELTGGLTILTPAKGKWVSAENGKEYHERMIPVRIACTKEDILLIGVFTKKYYDQEKIMIYKVSEEVIFI